MTKLQEKAQAQVKQMVGQMIGDDQLVQEGKEQQHKRTKPRAAIPRRKKKNIRSALVPNPNRSDEAFDLKEPS